MNIPEGYATVNVRKIYTDSKGRQWVEDPNGTHVDWREPSGDWLDHEMGPIDAAPSDVHGTLTEDGNTVVRLSLVDADIMARSVVDEAAAVASGYCGHSSVDHREALARVVRVVTGAEPDPKVLDHLMAKGARCYWVEVKR